MIVGTAGHVDHGKTTLIKALTGVDTDRLPEEKQRGISLELGFAKWVLPSGREVSVVDVPGHERLVKAMVAGAGGMQLALLVIAADEGVKPQTREHLEVCRLLGVPRGLVVLTRIDLASVQRREEVLAQVQALTGDSVFAVEAPVLVSAVTGEGLRVLSERVDAIAIESVDDQAPLLVPIDRAFTVKGFGVVVTGTVWSGLLRAGESVAVLPGGGEQRVRSMHVHGVAVNGVRAGQRVAVNLPDVTLDQVSRGQALARPHELGAASVAEVELTLLQSAQALGRRSTLQLLIGTAHVEVVAELMGVDQLRPGRSAMARVTAVREVPIAPGMRFVVRAGQTVGGGRVISIRAPKRRAEVTLSRREREMTDAVRDAGSTGVLVTELPALLGASIATTAARLVVAEGDGLISRTSDGHLVSAALVDRLAKKTNIGATAPSTLALITQRREKPIAHSLSARGRTMLDALEKRGLTPPARAEWLSRLGTDERGLQAIAKELIDLGLAIRAGPLFFAKAAVDALETTIRAHFSTHPTLDTQTFKALCGDLSRKFIIPLAEHFDAQRLTLRIGDHRVLRSSRT